MKRFPLVLLLPALLLGPAAAQSSVVFAQARPASTAPSLAALDRALDAVVSVSPASRAGATPDRALLPWASTGSGVLVGPGEILTSARLVRDARSATVRTRGGPGFTATVVAADVERDLALLRVENPPAELARAAALGDSDALAPGQRLVAVGLAPNGGFTAQEVSLRRADRGAARLDLDAALPANVRGGPLFDASGALVAFSTGPGGLRAALPFALGANGEALPVNRVKAVLADLRAGRPTAAPDGARALPSPARLGVRFVDLSRLPVRDLRAANLPTEGVLVQDVLPGSPAARAGLRGGVSPRRVGNEWLRTDGDVIVAVDGRPVREGADLQRAIRAKAAGADVALEIRRGGQVQSLTVRLDGTERTAEGGGVRL